MKAVKQEIKPITMVFRQVMSFEFASTLQKIAAKETSNKNACHIAKIVRAIDIQRKEIVKLYREEIAEKFGARDKDGKLITENHGGISPPEDKVEEFEKAIKEFEAQTFEINWLPLNPDVLSDVRLSAKDVENLGPLFSEECPPVVGPGAPHLV